MGQKGWDMPNYTRTVLKISGNSFISQDDSYPWQTAHPVKVYQGSHGLASPEPGPPHDWSMVGLSYERQQNTREPTSREELWFSSRKPGKLFLRAALRNCRDFLKSVQAVLKNKLLHFFPIFLAKYKSGRDGSRLLLSTIFSHVGTIKVFFFFGYIFPQSNTCSCCLGFRFFALSQQAEERFGLQVPLLNCLALLSSWSHEIGSFSQAFFLCFWWFLFKQESEQLYLLTVFILTIIECIWCELITINS